MILQFMVGEMVISNDDPRVSDDDYKITLFGVAAQKPFYGETYQMLDKVSGRFYKIHGDKKQFVWPPLFSSV